MNTRLKQFMAAENITQSQLADTLNVVRASVSHILSGRNNPSYDFIKALMQHYPRLNLEWLMFGKGKMYITSPSTNDEVSVAMTNKIPQDEKLFLDDSNAIDDFNLFSVPDSQAKPRPEANSEITTNINTLDKIKQLSISQRKVSKVVIFFDDGTYQEL